MKIRNPFKFLDAYTQEDTEIFFGREKETREIHSRLSYRNMLLVYGVSGCGKSSILQCGLTSIFREELPDGSYTLNWLPLFIRRRENILKAIESAFDEHLTTSLKAQLTLPEKLQHIALKYRREVYLIFDQFEELFIFGSEEEKKNFLSLLKELDQHSDCKIILSIREEYLAALTEFEKELPGLFENRIRIERFTKHTARQLITEPCRVAGIEIEENVPNLILNKLQLSSGLIELTWLQVVMDKLYRQAEKDGSDKPAIKLEHVEKLGKLDNVLSDFLNEQLNLSPDPELYENVLKCLISEEGTKKQARLDEIKNNLSEISSASNLNKNQNKQPGNEITNAELSSILNDLVAKRIIREKDDEGKYELRHDSLAARVYEKLTLYEKDLWAKKKLIELYYQEYRKTRISLNLLSRQVLDVIAPYEQHLLLTKEQREFIQRSRREVLAKRRRARTMAFSAMLLLLIVFAGFTIWALAGQKKARQNETRFKASYLNSVANELESTDPTKALRIAEAAYELDQSEHIEKNIRRIYVNNTFYKKYSQLDGNVFFHNAVFSPDQSLILTINREKSPYYEDKPSFFRLWDINGNLISEFGRDSDIPTGYIAPPDPSRYYFKFTWKILLHPNNESFFYFEGGSIRLLDFRGTIVNNFIGKFTNFETSSDGKLLLAVGQTQLIDYDHIAVLFSTEGTVISALESVNERIHSMSIAPDGERILGISDSGSFYWWDKSGKLITHYNTSKYEKYYNIVFSPNNKYLLSRSGNIVYLLDYFGNILQKLQGHKAVVYKMVFSSDGNTILTASADCSIKLWNVSSGHLIKQMISRIEDQARDIVFSPDNKSVMSIGVSGSIINWDLSGNLRYFHENKGVSYKKVVYSNNGNYFLAISSNQSICELYKNNGQFIRTIYMDNRTSSESNYCACFTNCGNYILLSINENKVKMIDFDGNLISEFIGHLAMIMSVTSSKCSKYIASSSADSTCIIWDFSGNKLATIRNNSIVSSLAFSDDSMLLATGCWDGSIIIWDLKANLHSSIQGHSGIITHLDFKNQYVIESFDSHSNFSFSIDEYLYLGRLYGNHELKQWRIDGQLINSTRLDVGLYQNLLFSPENNVIFLSHSDYTAKLYDLSMNLLQNISGYGNAITALGISPDGNTLVTAGKNLFVWDRLKSYETFKIEGIYEELTISDKLEYELIDFSDLNNDLSKHKIYEAAMFYFERSEQICPELQYHNLEQVYSLMRMIMKQEIPSEYLLKTLEVNYRLQDKKATRKLIREEKQIINLLLRFSELNDIESIAHYFGLKGSSRFANHAEKIKQYSYAVMFWERIMELYPDGDLSERAFSPYNSLSLALLYEGRFQESLTMAQKGLNLKNEPSIQTKIALGFLFKNKEEDALELISNYQDTIVNNIPFTAYVLDKMQDLKENNIVHPDYDAIAEKIGALEQDAEEVY